VPGESVARAGDLGRAERSAVRGGGASLGRRAESDRRAAGDEARAVALLRAADRVGDRLVVVPVDPFGGPAIAAKA